MTIFMKLLFRLSASLVVVAMLVEPAFAGNQGQWSRQPYSEPKRGSYKPRARNQQPYYSSMTTLTLRLGLPLAGSGTEYIWQNDSSDRGASYDSESGPMLIGADILYNFRLGGRARLRAGLGLATLPSLKIDTDDQKEDFTLGTELDITGVVELVLPLERHLALSARGFIGPAIVFAGGDLADSIDAAIEDPNQEADVSEGPFVGITGGFGLGAIYRINRRVGFRADLMWQAYNLPYYRLDFGRDDVTYSIVGDRYFLLAGVEF